MTDVQLSAQWNALKGLRDYCAAVLLKAAAEGLATYQKDIKVSIFSNVEDER